MKTTTKYILASIALLALIIACTKEVGLYTEVEFEITEEHETDGFISTPLATFLTITPEELLEDLSYSFSYKINSGVGYFEAVDGSIIQEGEKASFNPLSASLDYIPTAIGNHSVTFTASDTFGFTKEITLTYTITNIPVTWTAEGPTGPVLLGSSQSITVTLGNEAAVTGATYQRNYSFSEGSGNLYTAAPESNTIAVNDFVSIEPGTYELEYISNELGVTTIEFLLRDSNEQELITTVTFEVVDELSSEKEITSFIVNGVAGTITGTTIDVVLPEGTDLTALAPVIIHTGASISPESETNQDFSSPVIYTVTAQDETIQAYTVNCSSNVSVASVAITPNPITINIGGTENLSAVILPANATNQNVTWSSSDDAIASVSAAGVVTGNTTGTATITVTTEDGAFTATSTITVQAATFAVTGITVDPTVITITNGSTTTLTETIAPANATNQTVTWSSDNTSVATVNTSGVVTGVGTGEAKITVTTQDGGFTATSLVTVEAASIAVTGITIDPTSITIINGSTTTLVETINPSNATNQNVIWSSSDNAIATVNATGLVTGVGVGSAIITITTEDGNFFANSLVTVDSAPVSVTSVSLNPTSITITEGNTTILNETILPANATNKDVIWSSGDITVATVDASGVVTGIGAGNTMITVTTDDGNKTDTSNITIEAMTITLPNVTVGINQIITLPSNSVTLTGSATDADGIASYTWTKISGIGATIVTPTAASTLVTNLVEGTYIFRLTATDNLGSENFAEVEVIVNPAPITLPTVNAGSNQTITLPTNSVMLAGSATDADGIATYTWTIISGGGATIETPSAASTSVTGLIAGTYIFRLTATDNVGSENFAEVEVNVNPAPITLPTVNAGSNQTITLPTNSVMLVGSATDTDGIATYTWTKISGGGATIATPSAASTSITGLIAGTYIFRLTATDNLGSENFAEVEVNVNPQPLPSVTFDLSTGIYTAPSGSTVTVTLRSEGMGKGLANVIAQDINLDTTWNGFDNEEFMDSDSVIIIMPPSGSISFTGQHRATIGVSFSDVTISNNEGPSFDIHMTADNGIPQ